VKADKRTSSPTYKEVTMVKRLLLVAIVVAAVLVVAAPALAFNGYRSDYTTAAECQACHADTHAGWMTTKHSSAETNAPMIARGAGCAGCHSSNYDPQKAVPLQSAPPFTFPTAVSADNGAFSEGMIGCSMCHYGDGVQHAAPEATLANADICGQCHARQGSSKPPNDKFPLASPLPGGTINPQYPVGYKMLGEAGTTGWVYAMPLTDVMNIPTPENAVNQNYFTLKVTSSSGETTTTTLPWAAATHDGGALQYEEWAQEGHADALTQIKKYIPESVIDQGKCLECHSEDYRMAPDDAKPTAAEAKFGITCATCHDPHEEGPQVTVWNERNPQLRTTREELCVECHNGHLGTGVAKAGSEVHHPMKELMNGTGAIDVPQGSPSVHKGRCVQCHMPPTGRDRTTGGPTSDPAGNHTFQIIEPDVAKEALTTRPIPSTGSKQNMYYSACTTCHSREGDSQATYLQHVIDDRQEAMHAWNDKTTVALTAAAKRLGFKSTAAANAALNKIKPTKWSKGQRTFQKSFTNQSYVVSEGSWGIHNWDYARTVILKALEQARSVRR
jgi:hypothetical protein